MPLLLLIGDSSSWASQMINHLDMYLNNFWKNNTTSTKTFSIVRELVPENYFIKAENSISITKGSGGILNVDYKNSRNINSGDSDLSIDKQLNLSFFNLNNELTKTGTSAGATISIGNYSVGITGTTAFNLVDSDYSINFGQKLDSATTSTNTYGIKPLTAILAIVGYAAARFVPTSIIIESRPVVPIY